MLPSVTFFSEWVGVYVVKKPVESVNSLDAPFHAFNGHEEVVLGKHVVSLGKLVVEFGILGSGCFMEAFPSEIPHGDMLLVPQASEGIVVLVARATMLSAGAAGLGRSRSGAAQQFMSTSIASSLELTLFHHDFDESRKAREGEVWGRAKCWVHDCEDGEFEEEKKEIGMKRTMKRERCRRGGNHDNTQKKKARTNDRDLRVLVE
ncbi:hypothetical protein J3A83DRAFT_4189535 [Scleroderma citrinum]